MFWSMYRARDLRWYNTVKLWHFRLSLCVWLDVSTIIYTHLRVLFVKLSGTTVLPLDIFYSSVDRSNRRIQKWSKNKSCGRSSDTWHHAHTYDCSSWLHLQISSNFLVLQIQTSRSSNDQCATHWASNWHTCRFTQSFSHSQRVLYNADCKRASGA